MTTKKFNDLFSPEFIGTEKAPIEQSKENLLQTVARLEAVSKQRKKDQQNTTDNRLLKRIQIPLWSDDYRPVMHDLVRSALFTCRQKEARENLKGKLIGSLEHIKITYTGEELRQRDYDVYLQILHISRGLTIDSKNEWVEIDARKLVKELKWTQNKRSLTELRDVIRRLTACVIEVSRVGNKTSLPVVYGGPLLLKYAGIDKGDFDEITHWKIQINTEVAEQLRPGDYTKIDWPLRCKLSPLEKWLHAFYSTNQKPYPMKVETIQKLCGSNMSELKYFRRAIKTALETLKNLGFLAFWSIDKTDKIQVSRSQILTNNK